MSWADALENVNYVSVVVGVFIALLLGFIWYHPKGLGQMWSKQIGFKKKDMESKDGMPLKLGMSVVFYFLVSLGIASLMVMTDAAGVAEGALMGGILGFVFGFGPISVAYVYARRTFDLSLIDGGYIVVTCSLIGAAIGYIG